MTHPLKEWFFRLILLGTSLVFSLVATELVLTAFFPLYGGRDNVTLDGQPVTGWFPPNTVYRQISNEYDARTTITDKGHRVPGSAGNPDLIFLGDSFTYGFGLTDEQTFASIYCETTQRACANLGIPGSGTAKQLTRLKYFLDTYGWRPKEVRLFFFGMSGSFSAGNDFADNYNYGERTGATTADVDPEVPRAQPRPGLSGRIIGAQNFLLERSNLVRRVKFHWGPTLKSLFINDFGESRMSRSLSLTADALRELDALSRRAGFAYRIYLIVPVQDILRGTDGETLAVLNRISPVPVTPTADVLRDQPERFYYHYDGHLNVAGAAAVGSLLVREDAGAVR